MQFIPLNLKFGVHLVAGQGFSSLMWYQRTAGGQLFSSDTKHITINLNNFEGTRELMLIRTLHNFGTFRQIVASCNAVLKAE